MSHPGPLDAASVSSLYAPPVERQPPIVVAVIDAEAPAVLRAARVLRGDDAREIVALSVAWPFTSEITIGEVTVYPTGFREVLERDLGEALARNVAEVAPAQPGWRTRVEFGEPHDAIARVAREEHASLVVLGIGRHDVADRVLGGETVLRVIDEAPCPVLAVAPGMHARPRTVVVATDFSADAIRAVEAALPLLAPDATLHLVHVWERDGDDARSTPRDDEYRRSLPDRFAHFVAWLRVPPTMTVRCEVREGQPAGRVLDFAASYSAELIVAGRHGLGRLGRLLAGSVTTGLVRGARCSVLVATEVSRAVS